MSARLDVFDRRRSAWMLPVALLLALAFLALPAQADGRHGRDSGPGPSRSSADGGRWSAPPRRGEHVRALPREAVPVVVARSRYYYGGGAFYRPRSGGYVVVGAPLGARVRSLPYGYVSFTLASGLYFFGAGNYYLWDPGYREYVVVERPRGAEQAVQQAEASAETSTQVYAYPKQGQSEQQADRDRYDCHLWAVEQSGFDPAEPADGTDLIPDYRRAITACLEGRGYSVK